MPDRSVKVTIGANVSPLKAAMADGAKSVDGLGGHVTTLGDRIKKGFAFVGVTGGIVSLGAAIKGTFTLGLDFTRQLNDLQAVTQATDDTMKSVSATARQLGNDVEIPATSASDAAEAMTELAKGGLTVQQSMDAAKGTLQLAAAAQVSGAQAAEIQANALNTFGLSASDASRVADVLANTANAASGEITDFAQGMQQSGSVAKLFGLSIEDTSTALGLFANNGVKGSDAGTSLKTMLTQLATPSSKAKTAMSELGLTVYDNQGKFVGLRSLTEQLSAAQGRMSQAAFQSAAGIVFGSDAIRAASILASGGVAAYDDFRASVDRTGGAAELAAAKMKGLPGALQQAQNAMEDVALQVYERLAPAVETIVRGFSEAIPVAAGVLVPVLNVVLGVLGGAVNVMSSVASVVGSLPGPVRDFALALAGLAIANKIGLLDKFSGAWKSLRGSVRGFREEMELQKALARTMPAEYDAFGNRLAIVGTQSRAAESGISNMGAAMAVARSRAGAFFRAIGPTAGFAAAIGVITAIVEGFTHVNQSVQAVTDSATDLGQQLADNNGQWDESIQKSYESAITSSDVFKALIADGADYGKTLAVLTGQSGLYSDATAEVQKHLGALTRDQVVAFGKMLDLKGATEDSAASLEDYRRRQSATTDAMRSGTQAAQDSYVAWLQSRGAIAAAGDVAANTAASLDGLSDEVQAQVNALQALLDLALQTRNALSSSITGFVSPTGAYQAAQQKANARPSGGGGGGGSRTDPLVDAADRLVEQAKKDRDAIDKRYTDILNTTKARYDEQLSAWEKARDAVKAAADEAQRSAEAFLKNSQDRASAAKDEASALADLAGFGSGGSTLASALETQAVAQAKLNVARAEQLKIEKQLAATSDPKQRAELQDRLNTLIAQQSSLQAVAAAADKDAADARSELAKNTDLSTAAALAALDAMQKQASAAAEVIGKDQEAADTAEASAARKTKADDDYASHKAGVDAALKALQDRADAANKAAADKYDALLAAKNAAEERSKASSAGHGAGVSGAAAKMAADAAPSFQQYMDELQRQVTAQERWKDNIIDLASRVGPEVATELAKMGPEAAPMIQMLADQTDDTLNTKWVPLFRKSTAEGTQDILDELTRALDPTGAKGLQLGNRVITGLQDALKAAKDDPTAQAAILAVINSLQGTAAAHPLSLEVKLKLDQAQRDLERFTGDKGIASWARGSGMKNGGWIPGAASGEWITGGIAGQDSVLRWLMPGEAVIPTASAQANRPLVDALMTGRPLVIRQQSSGTARAVSVSVYLDGRQIGRTVAPVIADEIRIHGSALR